jgi:transposase-like protein
MYLNDLLAQEHRSGRRITRSIPGFKSFEGVQSTLVGIEFMRKLKKGQMVSEEEGEDLMAP